MGDVIHLLLGGSDRTNGDVSDLPKLAKSNTPSRWSSHKDAQKGDRVLIYIQAPNSAIVASAVVVREARIGKVWPYEAYIGDIHMLKNPIGLEEIRKMFPDWKWAKTARGKTHLQEPIASELWKRAHAKSPTTSEIMQKKGAGFGSPESNAKTEKAAVQFVSQDLEQRGFNVVSREADKIGYDLDATKGKKTLHIEVKGIAGQELCFILTAAEKRQALVDENFWLYAVTNALGNQPKLHKFSGPDLLQSFGFTPLSYIAKRK